MTEKMVVPSFATEAEEAEWWYAHRDDLATAFENSAARGELRTGTVARLALERATGVAPSPFELDPADIALARSLAEKRGLRYDTYLKMLLREALAAEERKLNL